MAWKSFFVTFKAHRRNCKPYGHFSKNQTAADFLKNKKSFLSNQLPKSLELMKEHIFCFRIKIVDVFSLIMSLGTLVFSSVTWPT